MSKLRAASKGNLASVRGEIRRWIRSADNTRKRFGTPAKTNSSDQKTVPKHDYPPANCFQNPWDVFLFINVL